MTIIPIGKQKIQIDLSEPEETCFQVLYQGLKGMFREILCQSIETILEMEVDRYLTRKRYRRRKKMREQPSDRMSCNRCDSWDARNFRRNGHYRRGLSTNWGYISVCLAITIFLLCATINIIGRCIVSYPLAGEVQ